jgi:isopenicillin N synthase-like dioxygenase
MTKPTIPVVRYLDLLDTNTVIRHRAIETLGKALEEVGFFTLAHSRVSPEVIRRAYQTSMQFFALPGSDKQKYISPKQSGLGGFSCFGAEKAKNYDLPDLKEFWHVNHNSLLQQDAPWPDEIPAFRPIVTRLYQQLLACSEVLLEACALYLGQPNDWLVSMTKGGNTVLRLAHYPPIPAGAPPGSLRAAPHEDINLITLLCGATAPGLEILMADGQWLPVQVAPDQLVVDTGDMLQNLTNGLFKSTTHRVSNPGKGNQRRLSMPFFVHPHAEVDLSPRADFITRTGGIANFPAITAGQYLHQRLKEITATASLTERSSADMTL